MKTASERKPHVWMFADDVVLCCEDKTELEEDLERGRDRLEEGDEGVECRDSACASTECPEQAYGCKTIICQK